MCGERKTRSGSFSYVSRECDKKKKKYSWGDSFRQALISLIVVFRSRTVHHPSRTCSEFVQGTPCVGLAYRCSRQGFCWNVGRLEEFRKIVRSKKSRSPSMVLRCECHWGYAAARG